MKQLMGIEVMGKSSSYVFHFKGDPAHVDEWRADGLTIYVIESVIPVWVVEIGMTRPWVLAQKLWKGLRLW